MSDFDKEAEREKLREQFEADRQKREQSEHMSELLLKGATMTNKHCSECGDPIFRYDGQEFCPTCQQPTGRVEEGEAQPEQPEEAADARPEQPPEQNSPGADGAESADPEPQQTDPSAAPDQPTPRPDRTSEPAPDPQPDTTPQTPRPPEPAGEGDGLGAAEQSLTRQVAQLSRRAEDSEDVRRQRELLAAAKEAAEALRAVRQA